MQSLATELRLPATAFVRALSDGSWGVRWFNPSVELPMCGHGSLAAAHALFATGAVPPPQLSIVLRAEASGRTVVAEALPPAHSEGPRIRLTMPADPPTEVSAEEAEGLRPQLLRALGLSRHPSAVSEGPQEQSPILWVGRSRLDMIVRVHPSAFEALQPDFGEIAAVPTRILTVTTRAGGGPIGEPSLRATVNGHDPLAFGFASRCFQPRNGVPEDPVCGAAHCQLAAYWAAQPPWSLTRGPMCALQASPRGGSLRLELPEAAEGGEGPGASVFLEGSCSISVLGRLSIGPPQGLA